MLKPKEQQKLLVNIYLNRLKNKIKVPGEWGLEVEPYARGAGIIAPWVPPANKVFLRVCLSVCLSS